MRSIQWAKAARWAGVNSAPVPNPPAYWPPTPIWRTSTPNFASAGPSANLPPNTPMEPVSVEGSATMAEASEAIQ